MIRPLESYSSAVLAEFIRRKMMGSYFLPELEAIERAHFEFIGSGSNIDVFIGSLATARAEELATILQPAFEREQWMWGPELHIPTVAEMDVRRRGPASRCCGLRLDLRPPTQLHLRHRSVHQSHRRIRRPERQGAIIMTALTPECFYGACGMCDSDACGCVCHDEMDEPSGGTDICEDEADDEEPL